MDILVTTNVRGNDIAVEVTVSPANQHTEFAYYLYDIKRKKIQKQMYTKNAETVFPSLEPGSYYVKVYVRGKTEKDAPYYKKVQLSKIEEIVLKEYASDCEKFFQSKRPMPSKTLPFAKSASPKQDILLARMNAQLRDSLLALAKDTNLYCHSLTDAAGRTVEVMTGEALLTGEDCFAAFSGVGRTTDRLILGMQNVTTIETADELSEQVGSFWLLRRAKEVITLETDYFGVEKLYYYNENDVFLVSNRIHLLVMALRKLKLPRIPNYRKIYGYLPLNNQLYMQNFSPEMDIKGIFVLPVDSRICLALDSGRIDIEKTELFYELSSPLRFDEHTYQKLLHQAAGELVDNARVALECPDFDNYVVHVTGGLDSRLVYCALSRLPKYRNRIFALTNKYSHMLKDFETAMRVVSKYPVTMGLIPLRKMDPDTENQHERAMSLVLGVTSNYVLRGKQAYYERACVLHGFYGEIVARAYYARGKYTSSLADTVRSDDVLYQYLLEIDRSQAIFEKNNLSERLMEDACSVLPGRTTLEKFENHYLYYRNGLHFNTSQVDPLGTNWGILQSKALFRLKYMTFPMNISTKLQNDLMYLLNPEIAAVEYAGEADQAERAELHKCYGKYPECTTYDHQLIEEIKMQWEMNQAHMRSCMNHGVKLENYIDREGALDILHSLTGMFSLDMDVAKRIYRYICYEPDSDNKTRLMRKLYSLWFELQG